MWDAVTGGSADYFIVLIMAAIALIYYTSKKSLEIYMTHKSISCILC